MHGRSYGIIRLKFMCRTACDSQSVSIRIEHFNVLTSRYCSWQRARIAELNIATNIQPFRERTTLRFHPRLQDSVRQREHGTNS